jgi:plastocyanin
MRRLTILALLVTFAAACSSSTAPSGGGGGHSATISVANDFFNPTPDTVAAGVVTFSWASGSNGHTLIWDSGPGTLPANTGTITSGTRAVTLQAGTYEYHCSIHGGPGSGMHGRIVVQ